MKQKLKFFVFTAIFFTFILSISACGSDSITGKYNSVAGRYEDYTFTGDEIKGSTLELKDDSTMEIVLLGKNYTGIWSNTDTTVTLKINDTEITAQRGDNSLTFEDLIGMGITMTFAKEGTAAENPENYMNENEKASLGTWKSIAVKNSNGTDISSDISPTALSVTISSDHRLSVKFYSQEVINDSWYMVGSDGFNKSSGNYSLSWALTDDNQSIDFRYTAEGISYIFTCTK